MKFRRNARMLGGILDAAPIASVFFLLVIFVMLGPLAYTPGIPIQLPRADDLPGTDKPTVTVAVDASNRLYYANQLITERELKPRLAAAVTHTPGLTLVLQVDESVSHKETVRLWLLARQVGFRDVLIATLPRLIAAPTDEARVKP